MFEWIGSAEIWASFLTRTAMEIVLGIDNIVSVSVSVSVSVAAVLIAMAFAALIEMISVLARRNAAKPNKSS